MNYTRGQRTEGSHKLVCQIQSKKEWNILKEIYINISDYDRCYDCYLLTNEGRGKSLKNDYDIRWYKIIEFNELINTNYEIY